MKDTLVSIKKWSSCLVGVALSSSLAMVAHAETLAIQGSDTLAGALTDAIIAGGLDGTVSYIGGGSSKGETALLAKTQGLAPMSRAFTDAARAKASSQGISVIEHVIGLDAVGLYVNSENKIAKLDIDTVRKIYSCEFTTWAQINPGSSGNIKVYARNEVSGTTETFKKLVDIKEFGACVKVLPETADIALKTSNEADSMGFSGLSAKRAQNRIVPLAKTAGSEAFEPTPANVRGFKYPLSRSLYVYEAKGSLTPQPAELELLDLLLDPSFMNPILLDHDFIPLK